MNTELPSTGFRWRTNAFPALTFCVIVLTGVATITTNCADPDLWGHVQYGREVLSDGTLPRTATWTYVADKAPWVNHENIAELMLAWTVDQFGPTGLLWMKFSLAVIIFSLMTLSGRRSGAGWLSIGITALLVGSNSQFHWHFRPQILTYLSLAALLALWQYTLGGLKPAESATVDVARRRLKFLWLTAPLMCFWANSHGGFAAGLAILCAYHGLISLQILMASGWKHARFLFHLSLITVAAVLATLVNPYGLGLWKFMLAALTLPRPEIADWGPLELWNQEAIRFWSLITVTAIALGFDRHRRNAAQWILLALLLWQGVSHCRHLTIFSIVCGFWVPRHLHSVLQHFQSTLQKLQPSHMARSSQPRLASVVCMGLLTIGCVLKLVPMMKEVSVDRNEFPVSAMQYLHDNRLHGKTLVTFNWAQYAIGCFAVEGSPLQTSRVAVDGRFETCYPRVITDIFFDFWLGTDDLSLRYRSPEAPAFNPHMALEFERPDLVLICRDEDASVRIIQQHQDEWCLLYQDSLAQIWGRRSVCDDPRSPLYVPEHRREISEMPQTGSVPWPALPVARPVDERMTSDAGTHTRR